MKHIVDLGIVFSGSKKIVCFRLAKNLDIAKNIDGSNKIIISSPSVKMNYNKKDKSVNMFCMFKASKSIKNKGFHNVTNVVYVYHIVEGMQKEESFIVKARIVNKVSPSQKETHPGKKYEKDIGLIVNKKNDDKLYVTVLMNCYNEKELFFRRAVESVFSNKGIKIQLIVSTVKGDACIEWCKNYPIDLVVNETAGIYTQLNAMIPYIKGDYVTYTSSNDVMYSNKLFTECNLLLKNNKKVCYSAFDVLKSVNKKTRYFYDFDYKKLLKGNFISDCSMVEKETFLEYMPFKLEFGNHAYHDLWLRIYEQEGNVFLYNDMPTWLYIITEDSQHQKRKKDPAKIKLNADLKIEMLKRKGKVTQIKASSSMRRFAEMLKKKYNFSNYTKDTAPTLFMGLYKESDYEFLSKHKGYALVLWCGADGLRISKYYNKYKDTLHSVKHIVMSKFLSDDLNKYNIEHILLPVVPTCITDIKPEKLGSCVYMYTSKSKEKFYGSNHIRKIEKKTKIKIIKADKNTYNREELLKVYKKCFLCLRLTPHDGLPNTVIEMGLMGRKSIYNGGTPNSIPWKNIDDVCKIIKKEYKNRNKTDIQKIHKEIYDYVNIGEEWLNFNIIKV